MRENENQSHSAVVQVIKCGEIYEHATHGAIEVTGIWQGTHWIDTMPISDTPAEQNLIIVRYTSVTDDNWWDESTETLDTFRNAIDLGD